MDLRRKEVIERHVDKKKDVPEREDNTKTQEGPDEATEANKEPKAGEMIEEEVPGQIRELGGINRDPPRPQTSTEGRPG